MGVKALGDSAWLVEFPPGTPLGRVLGVAKRLESDRPEGVRDVVSSFASVAVHFTGGNGLEVRDWLARTMEAEEHLELVNGREFEVPMVYDGEDLEAVARATGLQRSEVMDLHSAADYTVAAVGFSPGFPYLLGLPEALKKVPRRATPRLAVEAGSVAIAGGQAGIYPNRSPGGWQVLGRTNVQLFDASRERPALLQAGDRVRFVPMESLDFLEPSGVTCEAEAPGWMEVLDGGGLVTIQDLGRPGYESSGVSPGGAADRDGLRMANLLVGNDEGTAALELCARGPVVRFSQDAVVAFVDGTGRPQQVKGGEVVDFSKLTNGVRGYLAVAGGLKVPMVLGSASTDVRAGFGGFFGRPVRSGDRVGFGETGRVPMAGDWFVGRGGKATEIELRYLAGAQMGWFSEEARRRFCEEVFEVTAKCDRMGARLAGARLELEKACEMASQPVACGSVQVPPDGQPIVLMSERQTIGGYPQIGCVASVDLGKLARAWPGTRVRFREVEWEEARSLMRKKERDFRLMRVGLGMMNSNHG